MQVWSELKRWDAIVKVIALGNEVLQMEQLLVMTRSGKEWL